MINIIYTGKEGEKLLTEFEGSQTVEAKSMKDFSSDADILGFIIPVREGKLPLSIEKYIAEIIAERDNSSLGYIFAILLPLDGRKGWSADRLSSILADAGCVLSYYSFSTEGDAGEIMKDIKAEKFRIPANGLVYRLLKKTVKPYMD